MVVIISLQYQWRVLEFSSRQCVFISISTGNILLGC